MFTSTCLCFNVKSKYESVKASTEFSFQVRNIELAHVPLDRSALISLLGNEHIIKTLKTTQTQRGSLKLG
jgi:hypothetical protein